MKDPTIASSMLVIEYESMSVDPPIMPEELPLPALEDNNANIVSRSPARKINEAKINVLLVFMEHQLLIATRQRSEE